MEISTSAQGGVFHEVIQGPRGTGHVDGLISNLDEERTYPMPSFPTFPTYLPDKGSFTAGWWPAPPYHIYEDGYYDEIIVLSELHIHVGSGIREIRARKLSVTGSGKIVVQGSGILNLYIEEEFIIQNSGRINDGGDPNQVMLYYKGNDSIGPSGDTRFYGNLYSETADVYLAGSGGILGSVITGGDSVTIDGDSTAIVQMIYAPNAHVSMTGSGKVRGAIIANSFKAVGGAYVQFEPDFDPDELPISEIESNDLAIGHWKRH